MALLPRFGRPRGGALSIDRLTGLVKRWLAPWPQLTAAEQEHLVELTGELVRDLRWEPANGFTITDDMRVAIAAHASLLVLAFDDGLESYHDVTSVIVHPTTMVRQGDRYLGGGLYTSSDDPIIGEAHHRGPVLVSWDAAAFQARAPHLGDNVLFHEFAHRLDMLDGISDGTPLQSDQATLDRWIRVCTDSLSRLRVSSEPSVLRTYATTNPAEFFAVATEVFFTRPVELHTENAELYDVLRAFFGQDPAARQHRSRG